MLLATPGICTAYTKKSYFTHKVCRALIRVMTAGERQVPERMQATTAELSH